MSTTTTRPVTGYRYIDIDWRDHTAGVPVWRLKVDGRPVATAPVGDWTHPPFALTEGLDFTPQYHSAIAAMSGEPDSWVYRPVQARMAPFWPLMAATVVAVLAATVWKPALIAVGVLVVAAVAFEARR